ncbi:MAG: hypothetical protein HYZ39_26025 [Mycolicibacterium cosmeticum]|nr:hypothetical protein [Mycolicibacterium cosmeticum]
MNMWRKVILLGALAATFAMVDAAVAGAYDTIDYGTNQGACKAAEKQAKVGGIRYADCFETGPGHYSLALDD